jgi:hypothetical protein
MSAPYYCYYYYYKVVVGRAVANAWRWMGIATARDCGSGSDGSGSDG